MRTLAYFAAWLLALPGLLFAAAILALDRAIALGNLAHVLWAALIAFAYGLPLAGLLALVAVIAGFFRMGRMIGGGALLVVALGALAVTLERTGATLTAGHALFLLPTVAAAALAGWLLHAETRRTPAAG